MVERWCWGESWIQLMRGPRWEADSRAWDCPIVVGEPEWEGEMRPGEGGIFIAGRGGYRHPLLLLESWGIHLGPGRFRGHESREGCSTT